MRKIIGFKLNLRPAEILRRAKKAGASDFQISPNDYVQLINDGDIY